MQTLINDPDHCTMTPATWLGRAIAAAERCFGSRDRDWTILGCEFVPDNHGPRIWFPDDQPKLVAVQLNKEGMDDHNFLAWQIAHEAVHLLNPLEPPLWANTFEEGVATYFQHAFLARAIQGAPAIDRGPQKYRDANDNVRKLVVAAGGVDAAFDGIRRLRGPGLRSMSSISNDELLREFQALDAGLARDLVAPFPR